MNFIKKLFRKRKLKESEAFKVGFITGVDFLADKLKEEKIISTISLDKKKYKAEEVEKMLNVTNEAFMHALGKWADAQKKNARDAAEM